MIRAHREKTMLTLDVQGRATMMESPTIHELVTKHVAHGLRSLRIDLRDCSALDSTFLGTLLLLEGQLAAVDGTLTLVSPSASVLELLRRMGLEDAYAIEVAPRARGPWLDLRLSSPDVERMTSIVIDAHEELARASVSRASDFQAVVDELRRSRARQSEARERMPSSDPIHPPAA
jgi:anti-anti-sigma factor